MARILFLLLFIWSTSAWSQAPIKNDQQPISIEASNQLEWLRAENKYRATKDVVITQGDTVLRGDMAEALYDPTQGPSALTLLDITGNVTITQAGRTIKADAAHYDTQKQQATLTGKTVTIESHDFSVVAGGPVEYFVAERKALATGGATIKQKNQTLKAQTVTAWFDGSDNRLLRAVADKDVVITQRSPEGEDVLRAGHADYNTDTGTAVLTGNVRLARGNNFMQGERATIDLKTGYSSLENNAVAGGRVRAIFTPGSGSPLPENKLAVPVVPGKQKPQMAYEVAQPPENTAR